MPRRVKDVHFETIQREMAFPEEKVRSYGIHLDPKGSTHLFSDGNRPLPFIFVYGEARWCILEQLNRLNVVRMGMRADDQIDVRDCQLKLLEALRNRVEKSAVARVDQHPGGAVNKIGIAVIVGHGLPNKGMQVFEYFHTFCFAPL